MVSNITEHYISFLDTYQTSCVVKIRNRDLKKGSKFSFLYLLYLEKALPQILPEKFSCPNLKPPSPPSRMPMIATFNIEI